MPLGKSVKFSARFDRNEVGEDQLLVLENRMASISPVTGALSAPPAAALSTTTGALATTQATQNTAAQATAIASLTNTKTQPLNLVYDALSTAGLASALDDKIPPTTVQASGAFSIFMDQLLTALAAQQAETTQTEAATAAATAATTATAAATAATTATAAFTRNEASVAANSALESNVQALANQAEVANTGTSAATTAAEATNTLLPLQQSFDQFIASLGGTPTTAGLPTFLGALANNLHAVPSPLGNIVDSAT
jgi:hypothetical protein